ncbi:MULTISPECIES: hypothetical protein [Planktothricoides]|uniref:Uncharacterized protein n=2 Tax=Planktothricoides raciborskii TaxID=132608 RepID=A0AAU8JM62_9CYAN|nr:MULTISPECIES: hypothetical protein [Planktothricoides]KOR37769.1 hypothetical protein AM228_04665 [Planktothricoides sp. SR001]MBD2543521.1 hypothetical protein [Planktothricoides raciborskii FACHB-1370]MBD2581212.1 hypothetical protein [Planktothricoides raciborskii FACHB-1261]
METITIPVDPAIAKAYREADPEKQQKIAMFLNVMLKKTLNKRPLIEIMEDVSQQAIANGITPEILESILNDED